MGGEQCLPEVEGFPFFKRPFGDLPFFQGVHQSCVQRLTVTWSSGSPCGGNWGCRPLRLLALAAPSKTRRIKSSMAEGVWGGAHRLEMLSALYISRCLAPPAVLPRVTDIKGSSLAPTSTCFQLTTRLSSRMLDQRSRTSVKNRVAMATWRSSVKKETSQEGRRAPRGGTTNSFWPR